MNVYKIRLKGTELYYQPTKGRFYGQKSNLNINGKLYHKRPSLKLLGSVIFISDALAKKHEVPYSLETRSCYGKQQCVAGAQWEIVTYELKEVT